MKIKIEVYRGQAIEYDDDLDKFICDITVEDKYKSTKRQSLKDVRKEIDGFIKSNADFKPFKAIEINQWSDYGFEVVEVKGVRTDGKFIVNKGRGSDYHYDSEAMGRIRVYDYDVMKEREDIEKEETEIRSRYKKRMAELAAKLIPVDLTIYQGVCKT